MHFSTVAIAAAFIAVASAQELNPLYPFKPDGPCIKKCLVDEGNKILPGQFTDDPTSPNFMDSLALAHDRGTPNQVPPEEMTLYNSQYQAKNTWYQNKKAELASNGTTATSAPAPTATGAASNLKMSGLIGAATIMSAVVLF